MKPKWKWKLYGNPLFKPTTRWKWRRYWKNNCSNLLWPHENNWSNCDKFPITRWFLWFNLLLLWLMVCNDVCTSLPLFFDDHNCWLRTICIWMICSIVDSSIGDPCDAFLVRVCNDFVDGMFDVLHREEEESVFMLSRFSITTSWSRSNSNVCACDAGHKLIVHTKVPFDFVVWFSVLEQMENNERNLKRIWCEMKEEN